MMSQILSKTTLVPEVFFFSSKRIEALSDDNELQNSLSPVSASIRCKKKKETPLGAGYAGAVIITKYYCLSLPVSKQRNQ